MIRIESKFFRENREYALGISNLHSILGNIIETGFNLMIICKKGEAQIEIFGKQEKLRIGSILNASWEMQLRILSVSDDFDAFYFLMSENFCNDVYRHLSPSLCDMSLVYPIWQPGGKQVRLLIQWIDQMLWINRNTDGKQRDWLLRNGIESLLLVCDYKSEILFSNKHKTLVPRNWELTLQFGQLLTKYVKQERKVRFYADKLCVTPFYLGTVTHQTLNASPKTIIDRDTIRHLKTILSTSTKTLQEIADEMNFEDTSYMCKFFKKHTGKTMMEYRNSIL